MAVLNIPSSSLFFPKTPNNTKTCCSPYSYTLTCLPVARALCSPRPFSNLFSLYPHHLFPTLCEASSFSNSALYFLADRPSDLNVPSPCLDKECHHGAVCVVKNDEPVCECPEACPQIPDPVCGSDGQSYGSPCEMRAMGCALQKAIQTQHKGPCGEPLHQQNTTTLQPTTYSPFMNPHLISVLVSNL